MNTESNLVLSAGPSNLEDLVAAFKRNGSMKPQEWVLVAPTGEMHIGSIEQIAHIVLKSHPMSKNAKAFGGDGITR